MPRKLIHSFFQAFRDIAAEIVLLQLVDGVFWTPR